MLKHRDLNNTDLQISEIGLGTMNFGYSVAQSAAHEQLDVALSNGINLVDTAETYPFPPSAKNHGLSEQFIGSWIQKSRQRSKIILLSKIAGPSAHLDYLRGGSLKFDSTNINAAVEQSLLRLKTDYLDVVLLHWPSRATNTLGQLDYKAARKEQSADAVKADIEQALRAMQEVIDQGKVRYFGLSNETPWGLMQFISAAKEHGLPKVILMENAYHLLNRSFDIGLAEIADREEIGLLAYSPLAFGLLSGKHHHANGVLAGTRLYETRKFHQLLTDKCVSQAEKYVDLAALHDLDPAQMSIAYLLTRRYVRSVLIAASNTRQLEANITAAQTVLPKNLINAINKIHRQFPNPCL